MRLTRGGRAHRAEPRYTLGLMSGTSADGIDAACIRSLGRGERMQVELVQHLHFSYPPGLRERILAVMAPAATTTESLARLHAEVGDAFARAAAATIRAVPPRRRPTLIGLSGQTICHLPDRRAGWTVTLQLGEPARVAARTGVPVVAEFRQADIAAGGQGAPLVPWTDWVLFRDQRRTRAVQNIGGIANVTWLPAKGGPEEVIAFDTGPGNMVIDGLVSRITGGRLSMDADGAMACRGRILERVLDSWLAHPYFRRRPPKTTGRETFGAPFVRRLWPVLRRASRRPEDWVATATALTTRSIALSYKSLLSQRCMDPVCASRATAKPPGSPVEVIVCGGGARNPAMLSMLAAGLPGVRIRTIDDFGIPAEAKEALSFAMLAVARIDGVCANLPQATGAVRPAIMGQLVPP